MNKLTGLELKRSRLTPYHIAVISTTIIVTAFLYLLAAIPKIQPEDADNAMFMSYDFMTGLSNVVCTEIFAIMSAVMASKFVVEEYTGKKAILMFSYPVERTQILPQKCSNR